MKQHWIAYLLFFVGIGCMGAEKGSVTMNINQTVYRNQTVRIKSPCDFKGAVVVMDNCNIVCSRKGYIRNARLQGQNNKITSSVPLFSAVRINGKFMQGEKYVSSWWIDADSVTFKPYNNRKVQEVINSVPDYSLLRFDNLKEVLSDPCFHVTGRKGLAIDFGSTLFYTDKSHGANSEFFTISNSDDITIQNLQIRGDARFHTHSDKGEWGMGIAVRNSRNICLSKCNIDQCWGDNIYITGDTKETHSVNVTIKECTLKNARRNNISVISADTVNILSCQILKTAELQDVISMTAPNSGIDLEPNHNKAEYVSMVTVKDSHFYLNNVGAVGIQIYNNLLGKGLEVKNCTFVGMKNAFASARFREMKIDSCTFEDVALPVYLNQAKNVIIQDCIYKTDKTGKLLLQVKGDAFDTNIRQYNNKIVVF